MTFAKVVLVKDNSPGYLRDISKSGCYIALLKPAVVEKQDILELIIIPGDEIGIQYFKLNLEVLWIRTESLYFCLGGKVSALPGPENKERLEQLIRYYAIIPQNGVAFDTPEA